MGLVRRPHCTDADWLTVREKALARLEPPGTKIGRFRTPDALMRFRQTLQLCAGSTGGRQPVTSQSVPPASGTCT